jgi:hypothetical protein
MPRVFLLALLCTPGLLPAQERVDRRFAVDPDASIRITVPVGTVRVIGWDRDTVWTTGDIPRGGGRWYGGGSGRAAKLGVDRPENDDGPGATLEVRVPTGARIWVKTVSASIEVEAVRGEMDLLSVTGDIRVRGSPQVVTAESLDGAITAEGGSVLRLRSGGGPIVVRAPGGDITAVSVGGAVDVSADRLVRGRLESVTGAVTFTGNLGSGGRLDAETHGADVLLRLAGPVHAEFLLASVGGTVVNRLDGKPVVTKGKAASFTVGSGGAQITARTFKGTVTLSR